MSGSRPVILVAIGEENENARESCHETVNMADSVERHLERFVVSFISSIQLKTARN
jgi:hypothetical protein